MLTCVERRYGATTRCIPTMNSDPPDGIDNDCDGYIDNP